MSEQFHEMLAYALINEVSFTPNKARSLASYFADIKDFLELTEENIKNIKSAKGLNPLLCGILKKLGCSPDEFIQEFGDGHHGVSNYINSIF
ncbi:MAG: hypothetical protein C6Y22_25065 [Hapalosiphonaceae cyanobacterium JJU2]|nr:MAG: hypothetical protein C6Y22_25065 [Hapalosiphonaceae cyanobacterium JJU2]